MKFLSQRMFGFNLSGFLKAFRFYNNYPYRIAQIKSSEVTFSDFYLNLLESHRAYRVKILSNLFYFLKDSFVFFYLFLSFKILKFKTKIIHTLIKVILL